MSCNSTSNIKSGVAKLNATKDASRLTITLSQSQSLSFNVGDVIRYDVLNQVYTLSQANGIVESEVVGVVESINRDGSRTIVVYGSINLPSDNLLYVSSDITGASGGNDIFFLSETNPGRLQNLAPSGTNSVIKSIYQVAPHGSYTGIVINHIGYALGGGTTSTFTQNDTDVGMLHHYLILGRNYGTDTTFDSNTVPFKPLKRTGASTFLTYFTPNEIINYYNKFGTVFGYSEICKLNSAFSIQPTVLNWYLYNYYQENLGLMLGKIVEVNQSTNEITLLKASNPSQQPRTETIYSGDFRYWIESTPLSNQTGTFPNITNPTAFLSTPINFIESNIQYIYLPTINSHTNAIQMYDASTAGSAHNLFTEQLADVVFIIRTKSNESSLTIPANSFTNSLKTTNLNVQEINISEKLLELENRLSYLENRLSM
jgi:hypothetical protein